MRIVGLDIETAPGEFYAWRTGQQYVGLDMLKTPPRMLCFAARFNDRKRTEFYSEWDHGHDGMVEAAHRLVDEADAVLHFNGQRFDVPWLNTEFAQVGLPEPSPFFQIDLYKQTRPSRFHLASHKLQHVSTHLAKVEGKVATGGFGLWRDVLAGDVKAQRLMRRYNIRDVDVLFEVYEALRPWLTSHPNVALVDGRPDGCPNCGNGDLERRGWAYTKQSRYPRFRCKACGKWLRGTVAAHGESPLRTRVVEA